MQVIDQSQSAPCRILLAHLIVLGFSSHCDVAECRSTAAVIDRQDASAGDPDSGRFERLLVNGQNSPVQVILMHEIRVLRGWRLNFPSSVGGSLIKIGEGTWCSNDGDSDGDALGTTPIWNPAGISFRR